MISALEERKKAEAFAKLVGARSLELGIPEALRNRANQAFSRATFFDIETGDLSRKSPIYEMGFLHEGKPAVNVFGHPTEIDGTSRAKFSPFTVKKLKERFGSSYQARKAFELRGLPQSELPRFALNQLTGRDIWVQNLPFERSFLSERMQKGEFTDWARSAQLESFAGDSGLYTTNPALKKQIHQAGINQSRLNSVDDYLKSWGDVFGGFKKALTEAPKEGVTRAFDVMDLTRSVFALAQTKGVMPKTGELFAGTSIEALSQAIFKLPEPHSALGDNVLQGGIAKYMFATGLALEEGAELSSHQRGFFQHIGSIQPKLKQAAATKNIVDTFVAQQRFLSSHDPLELEGATIGTSTQLRRGNLDVLQPDGTYKKERFEFTQRDRSRGTLTTNIEDFIAGRQKDQSQRHGIQVDWDTAHKDARSLYINSYEKARLAAGGSRQKALEVTKEALGTVDITISKTTADLLKRTPPKPGLGQVLKNNWKTGAGVLAGVALLGHLFSGKDDEYNYIEGLRHTGFSGESRSLNTDFGSGWRGLIGVGRGESSSIVRGLDSLGVGAALKDRASDLLSRASQRPFSRIDSEIFDSIERGQQHPVFINKNAIDTLRAENKLLAQEYPRILADITERQAPRGIIRRGLEKLGLRQAPRPVSKQELDLLEMTRTRLAAPESEFTKATIRHERYHQKVSNDIRFFKEVRDAEVPESFTQAYRQQKYGPEDRIAEEFLAHRAEYVHHPMAMTSSPFYETFRDLERAGSIQVTDRAARVRAARLEKFDRSQARVARRPVTNTSENTITGMPEFGFAGANRKDRTNFGSPWQGMGGTDEDNANRMARRSQLGLNQNFQGQIGIRDIPSFRVEDADTVEAMFLIGTNVNLRLAGIDAPETEHDGIAGKIAQAQPFGPEAAARLNEILGQQQSVKAVYDPNAEATYGRAPAVLIGDGGVNINLQLVQEGFAAALPFGSAESRIFDTNEFRAAQREAQANKRGMWADEGWQAVYNSQSQAKQKLTHTSMTQFDRVAENFRTAGALLRLQNPDAEFSEMMAGGGKDDFNIMEGLRHGWAQGNRRANIGDFGSGYIIDKTVNVMKRNSDLKKKLMKGHAAARTHSRRMMDADNWTNHHVG